MNNYNVEDMAHIGCTVRDLQTFLNFLKNGLGLGNIRTQFIDFPYLSGVVGIENCAIDIGFAKKDDADRVIEVLDYKPSNPTDFQNDDTTPGSAKICYCVENISKTLDKCIQLGAVLTENLHTIDEGLFEGSRCACIKFQDIFFKFVEGKKTQLIKIEYVVSDLKNAINYFEVLNFKVVYKKEDRVALKCSTDSLIIELFFPKDITLRENLTVSNMVGNVHCCFLVKNIEELHKALLSAGASPQGEITYITHGLNQGAYSVYLTGVDGIKTELFQGKKL